MRERSHGRAVEPFDTVHAPVLRFFPELVAELGGNPADILQQSEHTGDMVSLGPEMRYRQIVDLMERGAETLGCPDFGMRLAVRQRGGAMFGPLGLAMKNSPTFGEALEYVSSHNYAHSLAVGMWLRRFPSVKHVFVGHDILLQGIPNRSQAMEHILLAGHLAAMDLTGGAARARRVHFRHHPVSPIKTYRRYFGCAVHFGQNEDGISFSERDLRSPIVDPDADAFTVVSNFIEQRFGGRHQPMHAQVRGSIMQLLWTGHCTNEKVAGDLNVHPRTLHRRLVAEGTSFQKIKDEVRRDIMRYYLAHTSLDFATISEKLGFSEQSVMTRSCNQWFAMSPTMFRAQYARHAIFDC